MSRRPAVPGTPYHQAYAEGREAQRQLVLDTACRLLETDGPDALTMRRLAGELGCSTSVLYTMFGGKAGVAEGLWREGFERLRTALAAVDEEDPRARLAAMGQAYRDTALANPSYYAVMFQRPIPGFQPSAEAYAESLQSLELLTGVVAEGMAAGALRPGDPAHVAGVLWAAAHGAVSLQLAGYEGAAGADARFHDLLAAAAAWFIDEATGRETGGDQR